MRNKRVLTSIIVIPLLYLIVWHLPPGYFALLLMAAAGAGQYELYRMARQRGTRPLSILGIVLGVLLVFNFFQPLVPGLGFSFAVTLFLFLILLVRLFLPRPVEGAIEDIAVTLFGILYVAMLFGFQGALRMVTNGKQWLVFMYLVIWAADTGAYYVGTAFGRHRLYEKISPKKSVEGLGAALLGAAAMALVCRVWFMPPMMPAEAAAIAVLLAAAGVLGDLTESLLKRAAGVKDSGKIIPGHGGMLDRMDSMLFAAPVLFYYLLMR